MHIEILQENLIKGLNNVGRVIPSHALVPILSNVLFKAVDGELKLVGGNGEIFIESLVGAKIIEEGQICLPIRTLTELVSTLPAGKLDLSMSQGVVVIVSGKFKGKINCVDGSDYPQNLISGEGEGKTLKVSLLKKALEKLLFCVAVDSSRPSITGVSFKNTNGGLQLAATDSFRLSVVDLKIDLGLENSILPAKVLVEVLRLCSEEKLSEVQVIVNNGELVFIAGDVKIFSRLINSTYPAYEKIIPSNTTIKVVVPTKTFVQTLKTASIFAKGNSNIVKIVLSSGKIILTANASSVGEQEQEIDGTVTGEVEDNFSIAFNCKYLLDFLNVALEEENITMQLSTPTSPVLFTLVSDPTFLHVIMPVRV